ARSRHFPRQRIKHQIGYLELEIYLAALASPERTHPRQQLGEGERLGEVVIGAAVEAPNLHIDRVAGGEKNDGCRNVLFAEPVTDFYPIHERKRNIKNDEVVVFRRGSEESVLTVGSDVDRSAFFFEPAFYKCCHFRFVFDNQHPHGSSIDDAEQYMKSMQNVNGACGKCKRVGPT